MLMNVKDYSRWRRVSTVAVYKSIRKGRIERRLDGMIAVEGADEAWDENTSPAMQRDYRREAVPVHLPEHVLDGRTKIKDIEKSLLEFPDDWEAALKDAFPSLRFE